MVDTLSWLQVLSWIRGMRADGRAFFSDSSYRLAGALLQKQAGGSAMDADTSGGSSVDGSSAFSCEGRGSGRASSTGSTGALGCLAVWAQAADHLRYCSVNANNANASTG